MIVSVGKRERNRRKQKRGINLKAKGSLERECPENILPYQFRQHLVTTLEHTNTNFTSYIKEAYLTKALLVENPVPDNINQVKTLGGFVKDILKEKGNQKDLDFENLAEKIQGRNRSLMG